MNWLEKIGIRPRTKSEIEISYAQCDVVLGNGAYIAHNHIFINPDPKSIIAGIIITCDDDPNVSAKLLSRQYQVGALTRFMRDNDLLDRRVISNAYTGGYPEITATLTQMGVTYEAFHPLDSFQLHEPIRGSATSFYAGSLNDARVQERTIEKMRGLLTVIDSTTLVSEDPRIRAAMIDKMREELSRERYLAIGSSLFIGQEQNDGQGSPINCVRPPQRQQAISKEGPIC